MSTNVKILYVMGEGRSGSTILDIILGTHSDIIGVGELWSMLTENEKLTGQCSCGKTVGECEFWTSTKKKYINQLDKRTLEMVHNTRLKHDQLRRFPLKLAGFKGKGVERYNLDADLLYTTISKVSGKSIIVDSTKQIGRAFNILNSPSLDVYLIHLVRDGRGILRSRLRDLERTPTLQRPWWRKMPIFTMFAWTVKNFCALLVGRTVPEKYLLVRYEDLTSTPIAVFKMIEQFCQIDMKDITQRFQNDLSFTTSHQIGGNQRAREKSQHIYLKADQEWMTMLSQWNRVLFWIGASYMGRKLGYSYYPFTKKNK